MSAKKPPAPRKSHRLYARVSEDTARHLQKVSAAANADVSSFIGSLIESHLSGDSDDRVLATLIKRLDNQSRQIGRLNSKVDILAETLATFILQYFGTTPPMPDDQKTAAAIAARARFEAFTTRVADKLRRSDTFVELLMREFTASEADFAEGGRS